jgi:hypothetical protein
MKVILRLRGAESYLGRDRPNRGLAAVGSAAVLPLGLLCFAVCAWRWTFELGWVGTFLASDGVLSHWQVWFLAGTVWQTLAILLKRYSEPGEDSPSNAIAAPKLLRKELP